MRITELAETFPSLVGAPGVREWDQLKLLKWASTVASHGERLAAQFVLGVWNPSADWGAIARENKFAKDFKRFDIFEAMNSWDYAHIVAMTAWIEEPFFP